MTPALRDAVASDLPALLALQAESFPEDPWTRGMLEEELRRAGGIFFVAEQGPGGPLAGWAIGWNILGELHVLQIAVVPGLRGYGLGRRLLAWLEERAVGAEAAWLEVRKDNAAAIALYLRSGYEPAGMRPRYYVDGCDALLFRKRLSTTR